MRYNLVLQNYASSKTTHDIPIENNATYDDKTTYDREEARDAKDFFQQQPPQDDSTEEDHDFPTPNDCPPKYDTSYNSEAVNSSTPQVVDALSSKHNSRILCGSCVLGKLWYN